MKSVLVGIPFLILFAAVASAVAWAPSSRASAQAVKKQAAWEPGQYRGWLYFLIKQDVSQEYSIDDITGHGDIVGFFESHSDLACAVQGNGSGMCKADFPMDIDIWHEYTFSVPDCTIRGGLFISSISTEHAPQGSPLAVKTLGDEFAISFEPVIGVAKFRQWGGITSGAEGCRDEHFADSFIEPYIAQFPSRSLILKVGNRTALTVEGSCSMEGLPRHRQFPMGAGITYDDNFSFVECRWMVFRIDMSAIPPEGGEE